MKNIYFKNWSALGIKTAHFSNMKNYRIGWKNFKKNSERGIGEKQTYWGWINIFTETKNIK